MDRRQFSLMIATGLAAGPRRLLAKDAGLGPGEAVADGGASDDESSPVEAPAAVVTVDHWRAAQNTTWRWFEKSQLVGEEWRVVALTTPLHRVTGERKMGVEGYVEDDTVPRPLFDAEPGQMTDFCVAAGDSPAGPVATGERRSRNGRPPSYWLQSLSAVELKAWLATIDPPEAGVSGMTFAEHLVGGHHFREEQTTGLTEMELAKLHGAAHHGF